MACRTLGSDVTQAIDALRESVAGLPHADETVALFAEHYRPGRSLAGAFVASLLIGIIQTFAVGVDASLMGADQTFGLTVTPQTFGYPLRKLKISQIAPILPYLFLVLILIFRPKGLLGTREG